jgi:hypothetical protein
VVLTRSAAAALLSSIDFGMGITLDRGEAANRDVVDYAVLYRLLGHDEAAELIGQVRAHTNTPTCVYQARPPITALSEIVVVLHASSDRWENVLENGLLAELQPSDYSRENCPSQESQQGRSHFKTFVRALRFAGWIRIALQQINTTGCVHEGLRLVMSARLEAHEVAHFFDVIMLELPGAAGTAGAQAQ